MTVRDDQTDPIDILRRIADSAPPSGAQERVLALLSANSFGAAVGGSMLAGNTLGGAAAVVAGRSLRQLALRFLTWSLLPLATGIVIGVNGQALLGAGPPRQASSSLPAVAVAVTSAQRPDPATALQQSAQPPSLGVEGTASAAHASPSPSSTAALKPFSSDTLARERAVLDRARQKLAVSEPEQALQFLEQHRLAYPNGKLTEEREAMLINVLVTLGQGERAKARGAAFAKRFPSSMMLSSVKAALAANATE